MRYKLITLFFLFSCKNLALNGVEFSECVEKAVNTVLKESRFNDKSYCQRLSGQDFNSIKSSFSEVYQEKVYPFDSEDMLKEKLGRMILHLGKKVHCYKVSSENEKLLKKRTEIKNNEIIEKAMMKMLGVDFLEEKDFNRELKSFSLSYCI